MYLVQEDPLHSAKEKHQHQSTHKFLELQWYSACEKGWGNGGTMLESVISHVTSNPLHKIEPIPESVCVTQKLRLDSPESREKPNTTTLKTKRKPNHSDKMIVNDILLYS